MLLETHTRGQPMWEKPKLTLDNIGRGRMPVPGILSLVLAGVVGYYEVILTFQSLSFWSIGARLPTRLMRYIENLPTGGQAAPGIVLIALMGGTYFAIQGLQKQHGASRVIAGLGGLANLLVALLGLGVLLIALLTGFGRW
jgi:hypothetical protein